MSRRPAGYWMVMGAAAGLSLGFSAGCKSTDDADGDGEVSGRPQPSASQPVSRGSPGQASPNPLWRGRSGGGQPSPAPNSAPQSAPPGAPGGPQMGPTLTGPNAATAKQVHTLIDEVMPTAVVRNNWPGLGDAAARFEAGLNALTVPPGGSVSAFNRDKAMMGQSLAQLRTAISGKDKNLAGQTVADLFTQWDAFQRLHLGAR